MINNVLDSIFYYSINAEAINNNLDSLSLDTLHLILHQPKNDSPNYFWFYFSGGFLALYLSSIIYYLVRIKRTKGRLCIAPLTVEGNVPIKLDTRRLVELFYIEFSSIGWVLSSSYRDKQVSLYLPQSQDDTAIVLSASESLSLSKDIGEIQLQSSFSVKLWGIEMPFNFITESLKYFLTKLPLVSGLAKKYHNQLFHVVFTTLNQSTSLAVFRYGDIEKFDPVKSRPALTRVKKTITLEDFLDLVSDAAYMVLELAGKTTENCSWKSMQSYIKGRSFLQEFNKQAALGNENRSKTALRATITNLRMAVDIDYKNYPAIYFLACALMMKRHKDTIEEAISLFNKCVQSTDPWLKSLSLCGKAFCYVQQVHRFAVKYNDIKDDLDSSIAEAESNFEEAMQGLDRTRTEDHMIDHSIMIQHIKAARKYASFEKSEVEEAFFIKTYFDISCIYKDLIERLNKNSYFSNVLGWLYLNILEIPNLKDTSLELDYPIEKKETESYIERLALEAESAFKESINIQPLSKLPHANLCLLYSTDFYRNSNTEKYKILSIKEGERAIKIDKKYTNGYRDLAVAMIRYSDFSLARIYTEKAFELTNDRNKKLEIQEYLKEIVKAMNVDINTDTSAAHYLKWLPSTKK